MASGEEEKNRDFYSVLGLKKGCSASELRTAYKKLALRWHPDRCSASGNSNFIKEAKIKFQAIQEAYSVLSDANKRFLYDLGIYDSNDEENGMNDFLGEMAVMMSKTNPSGNINESFKELQEFFDDIVQQDWNCFGSFSEKADSIYTATGTLDNHNNLKRRCSEISCFENSNMDGISLDFCFGVHDKEDFQQGSSCSEQPSSKKQKISSGHNVSSPDAEISA